MTEQCDIPGSARQVASPLPPAWVVQWLHGARADEPLSEGGRPGLEMSCRTAEGRAMVTAVLIAAAADAPARFQQRVTEAYLAIRDALGALDCPHPVRFWNYLPQIHGPCGDDLDRYMCFNIARFDAFATWFAGDPRSNTLLPTATAVGHRGQDLTIHCLAQRSQGAGVENPRQRPAYQYSARYGPNPPCFARATVLDPANPRSMIFIGGTASVCGEDSVHIGDIEAQADETFTNMAALVAAASGEPQAIDAPTRHRWLGRFLDLRVYYAQPHHRETVLRLVNAAFPSVRRIETLQMELCRSDLLVEIEGIAAASAKTILPEPLGRSHPD